MASKTSLKEKNPNKSDGNKFDKILKENLEAMVPVLFRKVLKIKIDRTENLPQIRNQITKESEPDFLKMAFSGEYPKGFLLQIDFESKDERATDARMLEYLGVAFRKYRLPVDLHLVYLPKGKPRYFTGKIKFFGLNYEYPIHVLSEIDYREFLSSDVPEDVLMAIFADPGGLSATEILRLIVEKLARLKGKSTELNKFINQLKVFSIIRNLQLETQKQVDNMIDKLEFAKAVRADNWFQMGAQEGLEQGLEQGLELGEIKKAIFNIRKMTELKFDTNVIADISGVSEDWANMIQNQLKFEPEIIKLLKTGKFSEEEISDKLKIHPLLVKVVFEDL